MRFCSALPTNLSIPVYGLLVGAGVDAERNKEAETQVEYWREYSRAGRSYYSRFVLALGLVVQSDLTPLCLYVLTQLRLLHVLPKWLMRDFKGNKRRHVVIDTDVRISVHPDPRCTVFFQDGFDTAQFRGALIIVLRILFACP